MVGAEADGGAIAEVEVAKTRLQAEQRIVEAERRAAEAVDAARQEIEKLQAQLADRRAQIDADARTKVEIAEKEQKTKVEIAEKEGRTKVEIAKVQAPSTESAERSQAQLETALKKLTDQLADLGRKVETIGEVQKRGAEGAGVAPTTVIVDSSGKAVAESSITKSVERLASVVEQNSKAARDAERDKKQPRTKEISIVTPEGKTQTMKVTIKSSTERKEKDQ